MEVRCPGVSGGELVTILDATSDQLVIFDRQWRYVFVNQATAQSLGRPAAELLGRCVWEVFPQDVGGELHAALHRAAAEQTVIRLERHDGAADRWIESHIYPTPEGVAIFCTDATARKRAETERERAQALFARMAEVTPDAVYIYDLQADRNTYANDAAAAVLGVPREVVAQMEWGAFLSLVHPDDQEGISSDKNRLLALPDGESLDRVSRVRGGDGRWRWLRMRTTILSRDAQGKPVLAMGVAQDLTQQKLVEEDLKALNEQLEQRVLERTTQLRALAMELITLERRERRRIAAALHDELAQMLALCKLKLSIVPAPASAEAARMFHEAMEHIGEAIGYTRGLMHELSPPMLYDVGLVAALGALIHRVQQQHGLNVGLHTSGQEPPLNEDLRAYVFEAVRELLMNVVKYARVKVATLELHQSPEQLLIKVEDRGAGFDPSQLPWRPTDEGGFGLFNIHERFTVLGGSMKIDSRPRRGTRVTLRVPLLADAATAAGAAPAMPAALGTLSGSGAPAAARPGAAGPAQEPRIRVLLADDHKVVRDGLAALLCAQADIEVVGEAADGLVAVNLARQVHPDVVVMDVSMPVLNGIEATQRLRRQQPDVPVIGLSMHEERDAAAMREAGAVDYLSKDGPAEALVAAIRRHARRGAGAP